MFGPQAINECDTSYEDIVHFKQVETGRLALMDEFVQLADLPGCCCTILDIVGLAVRSGDQRLEEKVKHFVVF